MNKLFLILFLFSVILWGCGESSDTTNSSSGSSVSYQGPGSSYEIDLNEAEGSFLITESESSLVINGTYIDLPSGFKC